MGWSYMTGCTAVLTQHESVMSVCGISPAGRWDGDEVVGEVDKHIHMLPVVETIRLLLIYSLDEPEINFYDYYFDPLILKWGLFIIM